MPRHCSLLVTSLLIASVASSQSIDRTREGDGTPTDPIRIGEAITVTATGSEEALSDTAASVTLIEKSALQESAPPMLDEKLRQVPGFTLFRRSGSRFAHPTAQGVSLRGVGASGSSRALVLDDGVPLNDPFGGWVYWGLVPLPSIARVEILRGGASDLYGSGALSGVVNLVRNPTPEPAISIDASYGSDSTTLASLFAARGAGDFSWEASIGHFATDGYVLVPFTLRGEVDVASASEHTAAEITLRWEAASQIRWLGRAGHYEEDRGNGTPLQKNASRISRGAVGADWNDGRRSFTSRLHASDLAFDSAFTAIEADRSGERITRIQHVPAEAYGGTAAWSFAGGSAHELTLGAELRVARGATREIIVLPAAAIPTEAGGEQQIAGVFVQDVIRHGALSATAGIRVDWSRNRRPFTIERGALSPLPSAADVELSPRLAVLWKVSDQIGLAASAYRSFRTPTLNELYRGFRVGQIVTDANPLLGPETLTGFEAGVNLRLTSRAFLRSRLFSNEVDDTIANVTLRAMPGLIERQRQNLGSTRSRGVELDAEAHPLAGLRVNVSWLWTDAKVVAFEAEPVLEGNRLPQIPRHQATLGASFHAEAALLSGQLRWSGSQFEDDRNELRLDSSAIVDLYASHPVTGRLAIFVAAENLLDERSEIGRTPILTLGPPRLLRAGLRYTTPF